MTQYKIGAPDTEGVRHHVRYLNLQFINMTNETESNFFHSGAMVDNEVSFFGLSPRGKIYGALSVAYNIENPELVTECNPPRPPGCRQSDAYVCFANNRSGNMSQQRFKIETTETLSLYD